MNANHVDILERAECKLVGFTLTESLNQVLESKKVVTLRESLEKRIDEIGNRTGEGMYLIQIYSCTGPWTPEVPYQHVIAIEVSAYGKIPADMITYTVPSGRFVKIVHQGAESQIGSTYDFINKTYGGRSVDIEYWHDIHALEGPGGQIDIYIPAR